MKNCLLPEEWKPVQGYENHYEVSSLGRVRSLMWGGPQGSKPRPAPRFVQTAAREAGYLFVGLCKQNLPRKYLLVHRMVLEAFVGSGVGMDAHHVDCEPRNNALSNLEWKSRQDNVGERDRAGHTARGSICGAALHPEKVRGEKNGRATLTEDVVRSIRTRAANGEKQIDIARSLGCGESAVHKIVVRRTWRSL